jgi:1,4-alpha-glucan branching enzyme
VYTESHDEVANGRTRVPAEIDGGDPSSLYAVRRSAIGAALVMSAPGVPMIFQGQEWADEDWFDDATPLRWERRDERAGIVQLWGDLCRLRTGIDDRAPGLRGDQARADRVGPDGRVLALQRWGIGGPDGAALVLVNTTANDLEGIDLAGVVADGEWTCVFASDATIYDSTGTDRTPGTFRPPVVALPAYGAAIYVRSGA